MESYIISSSKIKLIVLAIIGLIVMNVKPVQSHSIRVGFYNSSCPRAEDIVKSTVQSHFNFDPTIAPALLRMFFHDCFVRGCDASVLIGGPNTERTAGPNLGLRGFEVIDDAKAQLETACPNVVSCADILALAARDAVKLTKGLSWPVRTGRRDGNISIASEVVKNLPSFTESIASQKKKFSAKNLTDKDLVVLVGGHTIGTTACQFFSYRLSNFTKSGGPDPLINSTFLPQLRALCPQNGNGTRRVALDTGSQNLFDSSFFDNLKKGQGILESDQKLWTDNSTRTIVQGFMGFRGLTFGFEFGNSMVKMGNIGVKTKLNQGNIRKVCSKIN